MIIQGSNKPIIVELDTDLTNVKDLSVCLQTTGVARHNIVRRWGLHDVTIIANVISIPVSQAESVRYPEGEAVILVKCTLDGVTEFFDEFPVTIRKWGDNTILTE